MPTRLFVAALVLASIAFAHHAHAAECNGSPADCVEVRLTVDGRERLYQYHLPQGSSCGSFNLPVLLFLHGGGGTANQARTSVGYGSSDRNCYLLVFPQATLLPGGGVWNMGDCLGLPPISGYKGPTVLPGCGYQLDQAGVNDVRYIGAVLDDLKHRASVDSRRVYAAGWSQGGGMTHRLACELSDRIAAIGPIEGTIKIPQCSPSRAVPVIEWAALGDTTSPFTGGSTDASVPYSVSVHLVVSQLPAYSSPTSSHVVPSVLSAGTTDTVKVWSAGKDGSSVILHTLSSNLGHGWLFEQPVAFDWQELNWAFFETYALPSVTAKRHAVRH